MKLEAAQIHFWSDVFVAVAVAAPNYEHEPLLLSKEIWNQKNFLTVQFPHLLT